jgi:protein-S-isoprenylcysteine O-methyltransferase Ste14
MMDRGSLLRVWLPLVLGLCGLQLIFVSGPGPHDLTRWIGLGVSLAGLAGVILARYTLGRSFSVTARATELVTGGIYSRIRNPIYVSGVIFIAGVIVILREPALWLVLVIVIPMQIVRARREALVLEARFGEAYRLYRARTWF